MPTNTFNDADGDSLSYSVSLSSGALLPSWITFNPETGIFTMNPQSGDQSTISLKVTVNDSYGGSVSESFDITVRNQEPILVNQISDQVIVIGISNTFQVSANTFNDVDGHSLSYSASLSSGAHLPSWITFNAEIQTFTMIPQDEHQGTISIKIIVDDSYGGIASDTFEVTVVHNSAPTVANPIPSQKFKVGSSTIFQVPNNIFNDSDSDSLTYSATLADGKKLPTWITFNAYTQTFTLNPQDGNQETISVRVTADDLKGGVVSCTFNITILEGSELVEAPISSYTTTLTQEPEEESSSNTFPIPWYIYFPVGVVSALVYGCVRFAITPTGHATTLAEHDRNIKALTKNLGWEMLMVVFLWPIAVPIMCCICCYKTRTSLRSSKGGGDFTSSSTP